MNCFDWQNRASDIVDGMIVGEEKLEAEEHLKVCRRCAERGKRYRTLVGAIGSQPRSLLPVPIRKAPLSVQLPKTAKRIPGRGTWHQLPWYVRSPLEGVSIVLVILVAISAGPRIRGLYERALERSLSDYSQSLDLEATPATPAPAAKAAGGEPGAGGVLLAQRGRAMSVDTDEIEGAEGDDTAGSDDESAGGTGTSDEPDVRVGANEVWRFILKTDSPHELQSQVMKLLTELKIPPSTHGFAGIEVPGGIQFDLLLPPSAVSPIKRNLQSMAPHAPKELERSPAGETFTWFKNKSKQPIPARLTRVVIWLSQM
jgi:hypothetical protein